MSSPIVAGFAVDDVNQEKFWEHGLTVEQVLGVLDNPWTIVPNRRGRTAEFLIIGQDPSGLCIAIPIIRTHDPLIWRPVTAWPCKDNERVLLPSRRGRKGRK
jgi:hypothetical protein